MTDLDVDLNEIFGRAAQLSRLPIEQAARFLNAEFNATFYAVRAKLRMMYVDRGALQCRVVAQY